MRTATFTRVGGGPNGTVTIKRLTDGDLRLIANAIEEGSFAAGDHGGERSKALLRLAKAFRTPAMYPGRIGNITITVGSTTPEELYLETDDKGQVMTR